MHQVFLVPSNTQTTVERGQWGSSLSHFSLYLIMEPFMCRSRCRFAWNDKGAAATNIRVFTSQRVGNQSNQESSEPDERNQAALSGGEQFPPHGHTGY